MGKVYVFLAEGFEQIEALTAVDLLRRVKIEVTTVSITGSRQATSSHQVSVIADALIEEIDFEKADMLVLPGGMPGTVNLEASELLMRQVEAFYRQKKYIAAICAAPRILGERGMLEGKNACCFPSEEGHLRGAKVTKRETEVSDNIITARGMGCSTAFALRLVEILKGKETAEELACKVVYRQ